jgi:DNA-binding XRE family transcriptional regulator
MTFADRLKKLRQVSGMSQETLAHEIGCSTFTISRIETGSNEASQMIRRAIEQLFKKYDIKED